MKRTCLAIVLTALFAALSSAAPLPPSITVIPSNGNVAGGPGTVVGWGFTLMNPDPSDWVILTGSSFTGSQVYGTYVDYLSLANAPLYVAGPAPESSTVQQAWIPSSNPLLGLGEFDINGTAAPNVSIPGNIVVHYSVFSQDPNNLNFNPDTATVIADATLSAPVDIGVVPEPATFGLFFAAALPLTFWRYRICRRG
jgi:hypothetical protein